MFTYPDPTRRYSSPLQSTASAADAIERVHYTHDAMIDEIIREPTISHETLARHFGYSPAWVSRVINSDAFNARLAERKGDLIDPTLLMSMEEKLQALASQSLDTVMNNLEKTKNVDTAMKALELSTKALGFGARKTNVTLQQSFVVAMPTKIQDSAEWANSHRPALAAGAPSAVDVEFVEVTPAPAV